MIAMPIKLIFFCTAFLTTPYFIEAAHACPPEDPCPVAKYPLDGNAGVPTDTKIWTMGQGTLQIAKTGQKPVATDVPLEALSPLPADLEPNTAYQVTLTGANAGCEVISYAFTTGAGPAALPQTPRVEDVNVTFREGSDGDCQNPQDWAHVVTSVSGVAVGYRVYEVVDGVRDLLGNSVAPVSPSFVKNGTSIDGDFVVVAVSATGEESGAAEFSIDESADEASTSGCNATSGDSAPLLLLLAIIGAAVFARTARRPAR